MITCCLFQVLFVIVHVCVLVTWADLVPLGPCLQPPHHVLARQLSEHRTQLMDQEPHESVFLLPSRVHELGPYLNYSRQSLSEFVQGDEDRCEPVTELSGSTLQTRSYCPWLSTVNYDVNRYGAHEAGIGIVSDT